MANKDLLQTLVLLLPNLKFEILKINEVKYREIQKTYQKKACWHKDAENSFYQDDERSLQLLDCDSLQIQSMEPRTWQWRRRWQRGACWWPRPWRGSGGTRRSTGTGASRLLRGRPCTRLPGPALIGGTGSWRWPDEILIILQT